MKHLIIVSCESKTSNGLSFTHIHAVIHSKHAETPYFALTRHGVSHETSFSLKTKKDGWFDSNRPILVARLFAKKFCEKSVSLAPPDETRILFGCGLFHPLVPQPICCP